MYRPLNDYERMLIGHILSQEFSGKGYPRAPNSPGVKEVWVEVNLTGDNNGGVNDASRWLPVSGAAQQEPRSS
jgi:hypothetical protein